MAPDRNDTGGGQLAGLIRGHSKPAGRRTHAALASSFASVNVTLADTGIRTPLTAIHSS